MEGYVWMCLYILVNICHVCAMWGKEWAKLPYINFPSWSAHLVFSWRTAMVLVVWKRVGVVQKSACVTSAHQKRGGLLLLNGRSGHRSTKNLLEESETIKLKDIQKSEDRVKVPRARTEEGENWSSENWGIYPSMWFMHTICVLLSMRAVVECFSSHLPWLWLAVGVGT